MTDEEIQRLRAEHWAKPASQYAGGIRYHELPAPAAHDPATTHELILETFKHPVTLPTGVFSLDKATPQHQGRGRPKVASKYDDFIKCLKGEMHRQARLPRLRIGARKKNGTVELAFGLVKIAVGQMKGRERVTMPAVMRHLELNIRGPIPSRFTVQKVLGQLRRDGIIQK